jgi:hypothetical protein
MGISEEAFFEEVRPHIRRIWNSMAGGYAQYRTYPDQHVHRRSTRANIVNDLVLERIITEFDEVPGTRLIQKPHQLRFLSISDRVMLWFKKRDGSGNTSNYPTLEARLRNRGQRSFFKEGEIIVAGYHLNDDESALKRISFSPPDRVRPHWFVDVEAVAQPTEMRPQRVVEPPQVRLQVAIGLRQFVI